jgi:hypothetical protein
MTIGCQRAYFQLADGIVAGDPSQSPIQSIVLHFDDQATTGIGLATTPVFDAGDAWYTLDGRKLSSKPQTKGIYIRNGRKVVVN